RSERPSARARMQRSVPIPIPVDRGEKSHMSDGQTTLEVPPEVLEFMQDHETLTLATASPAAVPRASSFLYVNEGPSLYFWARATTVTARQLTQNPVVAFT